MKPGPIIAAFLAAIIFGAPALRAQTAQAAAAMTSTTAPPPPAGKPVVLDRVVGVINGDVILQSDVDEE
ncbi:MAG: hypothetical protein JO300_04275, partial [Silvibacterium sp.]|nr:hypothetical protein [Silvibacterium sp.]